MRNIIVLILIFLLCLIGCSKEETKPNPEKVEEIIYSSLEEKDRQDDNDICIVDSFIYNTPFGDTIVDRAESMKGIIETKEKNLDNTDVVITKIAIRKMIKSLRETFELYENGKVEFTKQEYKTLNDFYNYLQEVMDKSEEFRKENNYNNKEWTEYMKEDTYYIAKMYSTFLVYK